MLIPTMVGLTEQLELPRADTFWAAACHGRRPVGDVRPQEAGSGGARSIAGDGTVAYFGKKYVNVKGPASKQVSISAVQALVDQMLQVDYFNLSVPADCPAGLYTDAPGATTSLTFNGQTHTVYHYHGNACAPADLRPLEDAIDALADSAAWLECDTPSGACCDPTDNPFLFPCN